MIQPASGLRLSIVGAGEGRRLRAQSARAGDLLDFEGVAAEGGGGVVLDGSLSPRNAEAVRTHVPSLRPRPLGLAPSAGFGDRLGLATAGHVGGFMAQGSDILPVFAQQSIREMERLGRTPQQVLDDATFGALQGGWEGVVGADADHLKSTDEIDRCLAAGFTSFTLDPGEHVKAVGRNVGERQLSQLPWDELEDDPASLTRRYAGMRVDLGDRALDLTEAEMRRAAAKYGAAVAYTVAMYRHLMERRPGEGEVEVEVSVDETDTVTTLAEHVYMATEMRRLGMHWVSYAPRYIGDFEKGVEYIGDPDVLFDSISAHARVASALGPYKLSLHSGSDKFSIYESIAEITGRAVHLKTSGTSYLVALDVVAHRAPTLFRHIYRISRDAYRNARASYQVSARLGRTPSPAELPDERLPELVSAFDSRQILHVGYGSALRTPDESAPSDLSFALRDVLTVHSLEYERELAEHTMRHLVPFSAVRSGT